MVSPLILNSKKKNWINCLGDKAIESKGWWQGNHTGIDRLSLTAHFFNKIKKPATLLLQAFALDNPIFTIFGIWHSRPCFHRLILLCIARGQGC